MRIVGYLHSAPPFRIVGGERMTLALLEHAHKAGHEVSVIVETYRSIGEYNGMKIIPASDKHTSRNALHYAHRIVTHPELIGKSNIPEKTIAIIHNLSPGTIEGSRKRYKALIANSESTADGLKKLGIEANHVLYPPTIKPHVIKYIPQYVFASNLSPQKGSDAFYYAAKALPDVPFLGVTGGYGEQEIKSLDNVLLMGHGPLDLPMSVAKVFITPSVSETYGMTLAEAISVGIPTIATNLPAHKEVMGDSGVMVSLGSSLRDWVNAIDDVYNDVMFWEELHLASLERAKELEKRTNQTFAQWLSIIDML